MGISYQHMAIYDGQHMGNPWIMSKQNGNQFRRLFCWCKIYSFISKWHWHQIISLITFDHGMKDDKTKCL
jgi:hypothetical protein